MLPALAGLLFQLHVAPTHGAQTDLAGRWLFHPGDDLSWSTPGIDDHAWTAVTVPGSWSPPATPGYRGYGWYRLHFDFATTPDEALGLWFQSVSTVFTVFVDGRQLGTVGGYPPAYRA